MLHLIVPHSSPCSFPPLDLWNEFRDELSDDHFHRLQNREAATQAALRDLQRLLEGEGRRLREYGLPEPADFDEEAFRTKEMRRETIAYDASEEARLAERKEKSMYPLQFEAFQTIKESMMNNAGKVFFLDGPGGSGKTYLEEALLHFARGRQEVALACAWSGVAATLLEGGRTCHATYGLPVPVTANSTCQVAAQSGRADVLRAARLIIWDEAPMSPKEAVDAADQLLQELTGIPISFGGKTVVFAGDFRQVLPVIPKASREEIVTHTIQHSSVWTSGRVRVLPLRSNQRAHGDRLFSEFLLRIGDGAETIYGDVGPQAIRLPEQVLTKAGTSQDELIDLVFPNFAERAEACSQTSAASSDDIAFFKERVPRCVHKPELFVGPMKL